MSIIPDSHCFSRRFFTIAHNEHGASGMTNNMFSYAAKKHVRETRTAMGGNHDDIVPEFLGLFHDGMVNRFTFHHDLFHFNGGLAFGGDNVCEGLLEFLFSILEIFLGQVIVLRQSVIDMKHM